MILHKIDVVDIDDQHRKREFLFQKTEITFFDLRKVFWSNVLFVIATSTCDVFHQTVHVGMKVNVQIGFGHRFRNHVENLTEQMVLIAL